MQDLEKIGKSSSIYSINILKTFNYDKNGKAFNVKRTIGLSSPCVHPTNHCLLAVMGLLEPHSLALRAPMSPIVTVASYCKGQGHGMPTHHYFLGGLNPSTHFWSIIVSSSALFYFSCLLQSPLPIKGQGIGGAAVGGGKDGVQPCPPPFSCSSSLQDPSRYCTA